MKQRFQAMQRIFGGIVALSSLVTVPPLMIALYLGEPSRAAFFDSSMP